MARVPLQLYHYQADQVAKDCPKRLYVYSCFKAQEESKRQRLPERWPTITFDSVNSRSIVTRGGMVRFFSPKRKDCHIIEEWLAA